MISRRRLLGTMLLAPTALAVRAATPVKIEVWKDSGCGCCREWVKHLESNAFAVTVHDTGNVAMRKRLGMPIEFGSCHTGLVDGYVVEGHVPAREIKRLLEERPKARGLAVPRMPVGSPGMDGPEYGGRKDPYDVLLVGLDGKSRGYQSYR